MFKIELFYNFLKNYDLKFLKNKINFYIIISENAFSSKFIVIVFGFGCRDPLTRLFNDNASILVKYEKLFWLLFNFWNKKLSRTYDDWYVLKYQISPGGIATSQPPPNVAPIHHQNKHIWKDIKIFINNFCA